VFMIRSGDLPGHIFSSVVVSGVNPHWLGLAGALESALAIEVNGAAIGNEYVLVKAGITRHQPAHQLRANPLTVVFGQNNQMWIINDPKTV